MSTETITMSYSDLTTSYVDDSLVASSTEAFGKVMITMTTTESVSSELVSNDTESSTALVVEIANMTLKALSDNTESTQKIDLQVKLLTIIVKKNVHWVKFLLQNLKCQMVTAEVWKHFSLD